ncbi:U-box domain-containing protein 33-like isoform X2 [Ananas comosus]|uniref:RING-type E3 ubiquitin transferase n=1 Tax=Ananas comosus TaxID=4615 RepID=A0A6P5F8U1_ANACO|nr:U-box domain-containing protein 33-like isoform X2 [Ananas comosus]
MAVGGSSVPVSSPPLLSSSSSQMGRSFTRTASARSTAAAGGGGGQGSELTPIEEELSAEKQTDLIAETAAAAVQEKMHVAVGKEVKETKANLAWVLRNTPRDKTIVVVHVHCPATMIPMMGAMFSVDKLREQEVTAHRHLERLKMSKVIREYLEICASSKFRAETLVIEADDIAKGLVDLVARHRITSLVMGAAADKHYSRKMAVPKSRTALTVQAKADPSCSITFLCKGNLICTREAGAQLQGSMMSASSSETNPSSVTNQADYNRSRSLPERQSEPLHMQGALQQRSRSANFVSTGGVAVAVSPPLPEGNFPVLQEGTSTSQSPRSSHQHSSESDITAFSSLPSSPRDESEDTWVENDVYEQLKNALIEAEDLKREAYEESCRRKKAERDLVGVAQRAKAAESLHIKEMRLKRDTEEELARKNAELEDLRKVHEQILVELKNANEQKMKLAIRVANCERVIKEFEAKASEAHSIQEKLRQDVGKFEKERNEAVREAEELRKEKEETVSSALARAAFSEFTYSELEEATNNFDTSLLIGEGGYGKVYRGFLRHTVVAIKMLNPQGIQGEVEFHQEVEILSRVRHPNLVTLIGACPEVRALVYEFLPNRSLEYRLTLKDPTQALTWQVRMRIAGEICSALIFLHSTKPQCIVHGDLKPDNILLDANYVSKLGDFGICCLLDQSSSTVTAFHQTYAPKGTIPYMDPEYVSSGELTPQYDVYSFGIVLLQLITGKGPFKIRNEVQDALQKGCIRELLDASAGEWPFDVEADELAYLGVRCCDPKRKKRPELAEVWRMLEPVTNAASSVGSSSTSSSEFSSNIDAQNYAPSYLICPITKKLMKDPHVAADGFTYEAEAMKGWLRSGRDTSPVTKLRLTNCELVRNHAVHSAIQEWLQKQQ